MAVASAAPYASHMRHGSLLTFWRFTNWIIITSLRTDDHNSTYHSIFYRHSIFYMLKALP